MDNGLKMIGGYRNGNYTVTILSDGTKIRETEDNEFRAEFPENFDCKITNSCDIGCPMCHEDSTRDGKHGDILNQKFFDTLMPYTEIALGGGNVFSHPDLIPFLAKLKQKRVIANITINQIHFEKNICLVRKLADSGLINGIGISLMKASPEFIELAKQFPNAVLHVINGLMTRDDIQRLSNNDLKILILGYKSFRRGVDFFSENFKKIRKNQDMLYENLEHMTNLFKVVSFDNLAIEQLKVKRLLNDEEWAQFYMGDDGNHTLYVDSINKKFARCSIASTRYDIKEDMTEMFNVIKGEVNDSN